MLSHIQRLNVAKFNAVLEKGRVSHSSLFLIRILRGQSDLRVAAVTPKKVSKTAVGRNYMRRKIYESVRPMLSSMAKNTHILIFAKPAAVDVKQKDLVEDLKSLFVKGGLLR
ncbi:MAG: ribonuclease P protein component [bacterium]|nr:ribonuclease P protein component [bacterium]